ncbi:hypothetical protein BN871_IQ_00050 [Paenibacillus sp. P22]|nr:hypothetical protein BN871_IQ_00050 [Paenibacillus sp. P22]
MLRRQQLEILEADDDAVQDREEQKQPEGGQIGENEQERGQPGSPGAFHRRCLHFIFPIVVDGRRDGKAAARAPRPFRLITFGKPLFFDRLAGLRDGVVHRLLRRFLPQNRVAKLAPHRLDDRAPVQHVRRELNGREAFGDRALERHRLELGALEHLVRGDRLAGFGPVERVAGDVLQEIADARDFVRVGYGLRHDEAVGAGIDRLLRFADLRNDGDAVVQAGLVELGLHPRTVELDGVFALEEQRVLAVLLHVARGNALLDHAAQPLHHLDRFRRVVGDVAAVPQLAAVLPDERREDELLRPQARHHVAVDALGLVGQLLHRRVEFRAVRRRRSNAGLLEQILVVVHDERVDVQRNRVQLAVDRGVLDRGFREVRRIDAGGSGELIDRLQLVLALVGRHAVHVHDHQVRTLLAGAERHIQLLVVLAVRLDDEVDLVAVLGAVVFVHDLFHERAVGAGERRPEQNFRLFAAAALLAFAGRRVAAAIAGASGCKKRNHHRHGKDRSFLELRSLHLFLIPFCLVVQGASALIALS